MHNDPPENHDSNSPEDMPESGIIAYNLSEEERPGGPDGLKVRYKVNVVTGPKARDIDARQAEVIRRLLEWAQHRQQ
jgi:hypothetical protein